MVTVPVAMRDALLSRILDAMASDPSIFFLSGDFGSPVLDKIRTNFPKRFINVGIAEQNLINVSAGLALEGFTVFAYAIAPFITMRCYEQIRVNLALLSIVRRMNVNLIGVGAGYSYVVSGPTHQCYEDITLMRAMPNMGIFSPSDHVSAAATFESCLSKAGPKYIRLDAQVLPVLYDDDTAIDFLRGFHVHRHGRDVCLLGTGFMTHTALLVAEQLSKHHIEAAVIDLIDLTNFSSEQLLRALDQSACVVTLEEGFRGRGGVDSMIFDLLSRTGSRTRILNIGVEGGYRFDLGTRSELHERVGIGAIGVIRKVHDFVNESGGTTASDVTQQG